MLLDCCTNRYANPQGRQRKKPRMRNAGTEGALVRAVRASYGREPVPGDCAESRPSGACVGRSLRPLARL